ncbi:Autophagy-related protein 9 [Wickerhamiella sorbophila]|uniref:Autophagy-related protein 9 n=1 Tax=Wickerhamiella sorbophila TaxID=45607 RepID=A0A2T0FFH3_9ASCO|nr:Autophagy-related protein 9 [Wickerhamiella sorbophila]PRT53746.1 Autophagy-related protein 9 [Wickerhamiella sorbophila]
MDQSIYQDEAFGNNSIPASLMLQQQEQTELPLAERTEPPLLSAEELAQWRWANVENLDVYFQEVYQYFLDKGWYCTILRRLTSMITVLFVISFAIYLGYCIDYSKLRGATTLEQIRVQHCLAKAPFHTKFLLWVFVCLWLLKCFQLVADSRRLWEMKMFYEYMLGINEQEIQTISWRQVVERIVKLKSLNLAAAGRTGEVPKARALDAHSIANRIMRQENYLIALYNKSILDLNLDVPLIGKYTFLTKTLEWSINLCILDFAFDAKGELRPVFLNEGRRTMLADGLKRRFQFLAVMNIICAPMAVLYMALYYFFRYFAEYHRDPSSMGMRTYTPLAEWRLREYNELYDIFRRRLSMSTAPALRYISQFPKERNEIVLRFIIFICSAFAAVLGTVSIFDPELLSLELTKGGSVLFYLGILGSIIAVARGMRAMESEILDPEGAMHQIAEFTHYLPDSWQGKLHTEKVKAEFCELYDLKIKVIMRDLLSIVVNPVILWYNLPESSDKIIDFFREFSVHVDELGYVCSFAVFNLDHANKMKARADALDKYYSTADGKMLKSYLNFVDFYGPNAGKAPHRRGSIHAHRMSQPSSIMENSVMGRYDQMKLSVVEETVTEPEPEPVPDTSLHDSGVFGILNKVAKGQGKQRFI